MCLWESPGFDLLSLSLSFSLFLSFLSSRTIFFFANAFIFIKSAVLFSFQGKGREGGHLEGKGGTFGKRFSWGFVCVCVISVI